MTYFRKEDDIFHHMVMTNTKTHTKKKAQLPAGGSNNTFWAVKRSTFRWSTRTNQTRTGFNLADQILEVVFLFESVFFKVYLAIVSSKLCKYIHFGVVIELVTNLNVNVQLCPVTSALS